MKITDSVHADSDDYISILKELTEDEIKILAESGINKAANLEIKSHLSLTGASGKTGLYYNQDSKKWYLPVGSAPSNFIVKQSHARLRNIVVNEQLCLLTAKKLGIGTKIAMKIFDDLADKIIQH
ncbi:MAG: hypothetical protein KBS84_05010 [Treponema sp.]|nr:hypothetical protein [Candidatus Treponema scatequi]